MGLLMYKDIPYGGGGSDIEPNPSGTATEDLTKLGIDDTNYNVADADYRSDQKTYTFKVYDTNTHKYGSSSVGSTTTIRGVISAISALFDSVKTAINDHADVFATINTAISSINTALSGKADTTNATYTKLTGSGHRFGDIDISQSAPFTSSDVSTIENANMAKIKTIVNNLADYAEDNVQVESLPDTTPYLYRKSPAIGSRVMENALVGASVVRNQLCDNDFANYTKIRCTISKTNNTYKMLLSSGNSMIAYKKVTDVLLPKGHKCIVVINNLNVSHISGTPYFSLVKSDGNTADVGLVGKNKFIYVNSTYDFYGFGIYCANLSAGDYIEFDSINVVDLTQMFGTTIADAAYTKEQTTAGSGIAWLRDNGFDFSKYISYNTGTLESVNPSAKKVVGKNLFNKANIVSGKVLTNTGAEASRTGSYYGADYISVIPNESYYLTNFLGGGSWYAAICYDANKNAIGDLEISGSGTQSGAVTIPSNCYYIRPNGVLADIDGAMVCIGETATSYTPYEEHTYPISQSPLRGVPTLVNDAIVYDGDVRKSDGSTERKYGIVDLGTLTWNYDSNNTRFYTPDKPTNIKVVAITTVPNMICPLYGVVKFDGFNNNSNMVIATNTTGLLVVKNTSYTDGTTFKTAMSGVYLVYELATPTTEQLAPFDNPQISIVGGTEQFITDNDVPVGHESEYKALPVLFEDDYIQTIQERAEKAVFTHDTLVDTYSDSGGILDYTDDYAQITFNLDKSYSRTTSLLPPIVVSADYTDCTMIAQGIDVSLYNGDGEDISGKAFPVLMECTDLGDKMRVVIGLYNLRLDATTGDVTDVDIAVHFAIFGAINRVLVERFMA